MREDRTNGCKRALLPATAASKRLGYFRLGSGQSRAAARALAVARHENEAENYWDRELDCSGLAERIYAARLRCEVRGDGEETPERRTPIHIPPGKENTPRGRLVARINAARERMRQYEAR